MRWAYDLMSVDWWQIGEDGQEWDISCPLDDDQIMTLFAR
jgi:hypothetical protein